MVRVLNSTAKSEFKTQWIFLVISVKRKLLLKRFVIFHFSKIQQYDVFSECKWTNYQITILLRTPWLKLWSSLVEGDEGFYLPNCQTNLVFALLALSLLLWHLINTTACHLGRYEPSSPVSCRAPCLNYHDNLLL